MARDSDVGAAAFLMGLILASIIWLFAMGVSSEFDRKGYFYVANESHGWAVRMDNDNGNATDISGPLPSVEEATKLANALNKDLDGKENK